MCARVKGWKTGLVHCWQKYVQQQQFWSNFTKIIPNKYWNRLKEATNCEKAQYKCGFLPSHIEPLDATLQFHPNVLLPTPV
jgi:hypothetical protein